MAYQKRERERTGFVKWENLGDTFEGTFRSLGQGEYQGRPTYHAMFERAEDGVPVKVNTPAVLRTRLAEEFKPGAKLKIVFIGTIKGKQPQPIKNFDIYEDVADAAEAGAAQAAREAAYADLVKAKGKDAAAVILKAIENVAKNDPAQQVKLLRNAIAA